MKKLFTLGLAITGALAVTANAESLPTPTVFNPLDNVCTLDNLKSFILDWGEQIEFVDPIDVNDPIYDGLSVQDAATYFGVDLTSEYVQTITLKCPSGYYFPTLEVFVELYSNAGDAGGFATRVEGIPDSGIQVLPLALIEGVPNTYLEDEISGQFTYVVPEGLVQSVADPTVQNGLFEQTFSVLPFSPAASIWTPEPSNTSDVTYTPDELSEVRITWRGVESIEFAGEKTGITYQAGVYGSPMMALPAENVSIDGDALVLDLSFLTSGRWSVVVPSGFVILDGEMANTSDGGATYDVGVFSAEATFAYDEEAATVIVTWEGVDKVVVDNVEGLTLVGGSEVNADFTFTLGDDLVSVDGAELIVNLSEVPVAELPSGAYRLLIAENSLTFTVNNKEWSNTAAFYLFNFVNLNEEEIPDEPGTDEPGTDGVAGIEADANGNFSIYTLQGVKVAEGNADVVRSLAKGLYIINGKKIIK